MTFVGYLRKTGFGRFLIELLWPIKKSVDFYFKWVLGGRNREIVMRSIPEYRQGLLDLIGAIPSKRNDLVMVEIGSYKGESAELFLSSGRVARIYCVDPWQPFYDKTDAAAFTDMTRVERCFDERFAGDARVVKVKGTIDDFVRLHMNGSDALQIDFIYIDGNHTKEATEHDIEVTLSSIRPKLALAGHDYGSDNGVEEAVREKLGAPDRLFADTSWMKVVSS